MPNIGPMELIVVLVIALLVLGPKKLPEVGRSVGRGIREFKGSLGGEHDDVKPALTARAAEDEAADVDEVADVRPPADVASIAARRS
jgi:sec-independent protein translocase protein TatA